MKITWNNIDDFRITRAGNFIKGNNAYYLIDECKYCDEPYFTQRYTYNKGGGRFCSHSCSISHDNQTIRSGENHRDWSGDSKRLGLTSYKTYKSSLSPYGVGCRKNKENHYILDVKCYKCGKWYSPSHSSVRTKISSIVGDTTGDNNLYCSEMCKYTCSTYRRKLYHKGDKRTSDGDIQHQLRKLVLDRDNHTCQICGSTKILHCHHIEPTKLNPIESADMDNCIILCIDCHKRAHKDGECSTGYLSSC